MICWVSMPFTKARRTFRSASTGANVGLSKSESLMPAARDGMTVSPAPSARSTSVLGMSIAASSCPDAKPPIHTEDSGTTKKVIESR